jgi:hypothetical protein
LVRETGFLNLLVRKARKTRNQGGEIGFSFGLGFTGPNTREGEKEEEEEAEDKLLYCQFEG